MSAAQPSTSPRPARRTVRRTAFALPVATLLAGALAVACSDDAGRAAPTAPLAATAAAASDASVGATMAFGRPPLKAFDRMSLKGMEHGGAGHPMDKVYPGTVVIRRGQTVAFDSYPVHQIAIYAPGTKPSDIRLDPDHLADVEVPWGIERDVLIDDPNNRLAVSPITWNRETWTPDAATFSKPGRYLVICTIIFHYTEAKMYGWVEVR